MKKKVLIITYYWPPSGGAGVQRWLKFTKYLCELGLEPHVVIPSNPNYPVIDTSFEKDIENLDIKIIKIPIWEPYNIYRKFMGFSEDYKINHTFSAGDKSNNWKSKLALWFKSNVFIPDPRIFWTLNTHSIIEKYIEVQQIDTIITTSPPHSVQLIGYKLKRKMKNLKWIADLRDPWTTIYFSNTLHQSFISKKINTWLEKKVLQKADHVITVSEALSEEFSILSNRKIHCITNGYDADDIQSNTEFDYSSFSMSYIGTLFKSYNMPNFWEVISEICSENMQFKKDLKITIAGSIDSSIIEKFNELNISDNINYLGYVNHNKINEIIQKTQILLLTTPENNNKGILTGKVFEYMATLKPILCITSQYNNLWNLIQETKSGYCASFDNKQEIKHIVLSLYENYTKQRFGKNDIENIKKYNRKSLTEELIKIINE
jgi:glycosyltransferase involved in cell wall biosynthesis